MAAASPSAAARDRPLASRCARPCPVGSGCAARERTERTWTVGRIGGFDLTCDIRAGRHDARLEPDLALERTAFAQAIGIEIGRAHV